MNRNWRAIQFVVLFSCLGAVFASAQTQPQSFTMTGTNSPCAIIRASNNATVGIIVSGTWSGTLTPNLQIFTTNGAPTAPTTVTPTDSTTPTPQLTITASKGYTSGIGGFTQFNLCPTAWSSGTAVVSLYATPALNRASLGVGGSTTPSFGLLTSGTNNSMAGICGTGCSLGTSGTGTITATNGLPAATQGQHYGKNGTSVVAINPFKWDTSLETGADAGTRAQNVYSRCANSGLNLGCTASFENEASVDMLVDPFCGNTSGGAAFAPLKTVLVLSQKVRNFTEVPINPIGGGCTYLTFSPGHADLGGPSFGAGGGASLIAGTMLVNGASFPKAGSTTTPCVGCNTYNGTVTAFVDDTTQSGNGAACGLTFTGATNTGRVCVVGSSTLFTTQLTIGGIMQIPYNRASNQIVGRIENIIDPTHLILTTQYAAGSTVAAAGYSVTYCTVCEAIGGQGFSGSVNQGVMVHDMTIDGNDTPGSVGFMNFADAELNEITNVHIQKMATSAVDYEGNIPQTGTMRNVFMNLSSTCTAVNSVAMMINGRQTGFNNSAPQGLDHAWFAANQCDSNSDLGTAFIINGGNFAGMDWHIERSGAVAGWIGHTMSCATYPCPGVLFAGNTAIPTKIKLDQLDFSCGSCSGAGVTALEIGNSFASPVTVTISNLSTDTNYTNTLIDLNKSNTFTSANNPGISQYILDSAAFPFVLTGNCTETTNGVCLGNGTLSMTSSGSVKWSLSAATIDFSGTSLMKWSTGPGASTTTSAGTTFDTTNFNYHGGANGVDNLFAIIPSSVPITTGHFAKWTLTGSNATLTDSNDLGTPSAGVLTNATGYPLNSLAAPTVGYTLANGGVAQVWNAALTTNNKAAFTFGETTAASAGTLGNQANLTVKTIAGSTALPLTVSDSLSGSQTLPAFYVAPTWNTSGVVDAGIYEVVTNTASGNGSALLHFLLGATDFFKISIQSATPATAATNGPNLALGGSLPTITTPGTTPYLNINTLAKGTKNTCTFALTTSTFTLALSPVGLCTFTLPNAAVAWYWSCTAGWSNNAGTTPTFAIGVTWAQAPSAAFQMARIDTTNAGVGVQGTTATTTNSNIVATGTLTPGATVFTADASGTFTGSATSGTFSPTVSLTGTSATGTMTGGCEIN